MQVGDKFFTIAYTWDTRVIEVEIIEIKTVMGITYIHIQDTEDNFNRWFLPIDVINQWKFDTKELAENKLKEIIE
jgi:hypothetical protein